ncbi:hypothetical protein NX059_008551 [Plenodomus lindquistii]|nr:hypothetical protein NX059_008551 [Plenodomus lindquistii]
MKKDKFAQEVSCKSTTVGSVHSSSNKSSSSTRNKTDRKLHSFTLKSLGRSSGRLRNGLKIFEKHWGAGRGGGNRQGNTSSQTISLARRVIGRFSYPSSYHPGERLRLQYLFADV